MKIYFRKGQVLINYINWIIILPIIYFLQIQNSNAQNSLTTNSQIYLQSSSKDLARMYTNLTMKNRDWDALISTFTEEYFFSLKGTSNEISLENINQIKKLLSPGFPEFYKKTFTKAILNTTNDKKFLFLLFCSAAEMNLTQDDILYFRRVNRNIDFVNTLEFNFRRIYRSEMKIWIKSLYN